MPSRNRAHVIRDFTLVFCLVFSFYAGPLPFVQVSFLAGMICLCLVFSKKERTLDLIRLMLDGNCRCIFVGIFIIMINCLIFSSVHLTADVTYLSSMISLLVKIFCTYAVVEVIFDRNRPMVYYEKILIYIFVFQTFIQMLGYFYRPFSDIIVLFNHDYKLHEGYGGIRGNGLSGATGSGLGFTYGLVIILYTKVYLIETRKLTAPVVAMGLLLFLGIFFSARTGFLGCILSAFYFLFSPCSKIEKIKKVFIFVIFLAFFAGLLFLVFRNMVSVLIENVLPYVFEFFYQRAKTGRLETASTNVLLEMWTKSEFITDENFLFGDGWFTDPVTGKYYHRVDVGYLRNMFYWGFVGTVVNYFCQMLIFRGILLSRDTGTKRFVFYILLCLFIIELKANAVAFAHITMIFCIYYILLYAKYSQKKLTSKQSQP